WTLCRWRRTSGGSTSCAPGTELTPDSVPDPRGTSIEFVLDTPTVRDFVADVRESIARAASPREACEAIRPRFSQLLAGPDWLPTRYQAAAPESGMGSGIGPSVVCRAG